MALRDIYVTSERGTISYGLARAFDVGCIAASSALIGYLASVLLALQKMTSSHWGKSLGHQFIVEITCFQTAERVLWNL